MLTQLYPRDHRHGSLSEAPWHLPCQESWLLHWTRVGGLGERIAESEVVAARRGRVEESHQALKGKRFCPGLVEGEVRESLERATGVSSTGKAF